MNSKTVSLKVSLLKFARMASLKETVFTDLMKLSCTYFVFLQTVSHDYILKSASSDFLTYQNLSLSVVHFTNERALSGPFLVSRTGDAGLTVHTINKSFFGHYELKVILF